MLIDLRSDTVTKPTKEMLAAMFSAEVGDDVWGNDPTVKALEEKVATLFGHEAALFCPSGTMTNQIAIKVHTQPPGEVVCDETAHIYRYEGGGIAFNSGLSNRLIRGKKGQFSLEQLKAEINADDIHFPSTQMVSIENTCNKGGGTVWDLNEVDRISQFCRTNKLPLHLDGARIYNAIIAQKSSEKEIGKHFDSISLCLSKGLACPVGSLLIGSKSFIKQAIRIRKVMGGGMRQVGYLAAAGIYALDNNVKRLSEDHHRAKQLAQVLKSVSFIEEVVPPQTNIVLFKLSNSISTESFIGQMQSKNILVAAMGNQKIRLVTHLDFNDAMMDKFQLAIHSI
ncbi:MAG: low-specificity L-threonine aldolase [Vicingaceae bacterium]